MGSRIKTQYTFEEGGDGRWYAGTVKSVFADGRVHICYDDGDQWTGAGRLVHLANPSAGPPLAKTAAVELASGHPVGRKAPGSRLEMFTGMFAKPDRDHDQSASNSGASSSSGEEEKTSMLNHSTGRCPMDQRSLILSCVCCMIIIVSFILAVSLFLFL